MDELVVTIPLILSVISASILQFILGFNTAIMNAPQAVVFPGHSTLDWAIAVASLSIGGPFGAIAGGILANMKGRKGAIIVNVWIYFVGSIIMALAPNIYWLIPARIVIGVGSGLASVVVPIYLGILTNLSMIIDY